MKNYIILAIILLVAVGGYFFPKAMALGGAPSPIGSTQTSPTLAETSLSPLTVTSTSTSILNNSYDKVVSGLFIYCSGITQASTQVASWTLTAATGTTAYNTNANYIGTLTMATATPTVLVASSTEGTAGGGIVPTSLVWPAGTYLQFNFNATDTAACTFGAKVIPL